MNKARFVFSIAAVALLVATLRGSSPTPLSLHLRRAMPTE